tara:strand:+ start:4317 stop:4598 length:282 start_codon:yes stop_codon:yes gene_type:complete
MISHQVSGSNSFSRSSIRRLKQFSLELDLYLALKNLRVLNFNKSKKVLIDLNSLTPIEIKNETQCIVNYIDSDYSYITVGSFSFLVKNSDIKA